MLRSIVSGGFLFALVLASSTSFSADLQKAEWVDAGDGKELVKTYPFTAEVLQDVRDVAGGSDPIGSATHIMTARIDLADKARFLFLQINDENYCGAAAGCATVIYADTGEGFSIAKETQLPGNIYAGLCKDKPAIAVELNEFMAVSDSFKVFHLQDKKLVDGKNFAKLEEIDLCAE